MGTLALGQTTTPRASSDSSIQRANDLLKDGKPKEALVLLTSVAEKDPKTPGLEPRLGEAYFRDHQFAEAIVHLQAALQQRPNDLDSVQFLALSFYHVGEFQEALPLLEKLGPQLPSDSAASPDLLSICYVMTQQLDKARQSLSKVFSVPEDSAMAYLVLAKLMVRQGRIEVAIPQIETAIRLDPRLLMAHFLLGEIDLYQSKPQAAVVEFQRELTLNPTLWLVYWRLGDAYVRVGNYDEAEKNLKEAVWLNDGSSGALVLLGEIALKRNDPALGAGFLERALTLNPQDADAHDMLASAYKALGRDGEAKQQTELSKKLRSERQSRKEPSVAIP